MTRISRRRFLCSGVGLGAGRPVIHLDRHIVVFGAWGQRLDGHLRQVIAGQGRAAIVEHDLVRTGCDFHVKAPFSEAGDRNLGGAGIQTAERGRTTVEPPEPRCDEARIDLLLGSCLLVFERAQGRFAFFRLR